jgi:heptaprenyl diphosphate synthase
MDLFEICHVDKVRIDNEIIQIINSDATLSNEYKEMILKLSINNGKKLRPLFTIIGSYFGTVEPDDIYKYAAIFELVHTASLIHDDVIDGAETRRGIPSIHTLTDNYTAVMIGNYLLGRCGELISENNLEDHYYNYMTLSDLCDSEIKQQQLLFNFNITLDEYIDKTKNKTALLIAASFICGASIAKIERKYLKYIYNYSINLGISFQIIDDILDFTQDKKQLGKPVGQDLYNGNITLPTIYALKDKTLKQQIKDLTPQSDSVEFEKAIENILASEAIEKSKKLNKKYLKAARNAARHLKRYSHADKYLYSIIEELEQRTY